MKLSEEMKAVVANAPYITFITMNQDGTVHPIIVGGKEADAETIRIGVWRMETTQKNLQANAKAWVAAAAVDNGAKGFRFEGTASVADGKVVFCPETAEALI